MSIIKDYLNSQQWQFTEIEGKNIILFGIGGENGNFQCIVDFIEKEKKMIFFSVCGANTPLEKRQIILELLNKLNYGIFFGNFEMDMEDGEIRFKTSISFENIELNQDFIEQFIITNISTMDKSLPAIMGIMYGGMSIEKALELSKIE